MTEPSKGKVAKIVDNYTIVINLGKNNGVKMNMKFVIYDEGEMIKDPETNEELGKLELVKGRVEVTNVQEKMCVAETYETEEERIYNPLESISEYLYPKSIHVKKPLPIERDVESEPLKVHVGDLVRSIE